MSPVHVIVGEDPRAEQMWANAFTGAVDLYRFDRNVDAFERLTAAQAPIDLVVLTPAQRGPFNLTPDQFVARVLEGPLGNSPLLANLHVIVVGEPLGRSHPRAMAVSTLDAAIRLVKFGEVEQAPRPAPVAPAAAIEPTTASRRVDLDALGDVAEFSGSIISRIWNAGADSTSGDVDLGIVGGGAAAAPESAPVLEPEAGAMPPDAIGPTPLFSRAAPAGFVAAGGGRPAAEPAPAAQPAVPAPVPQQPAAAPVMQVGAPGETIEVATGALQPVRGYHLEGGGAYRGPAIRHGQLHGAGYDAGGGQPVPPALASQVQSMVYGSVQVGNPHDPLLVWSSSARAAQAPQAGAQPPAAVQGGGVPPHAGIASVPVAAPAQAVAPVRTVPMDPPTGAYPGVAPQQHAPADRFLARAESQGGDVSFG